MLAAAVVAVVAILAGGCNTSPYAAQVGTVVIPQTQLNAELAAEASNPSFVSAFDRANSSALVGVRGSAPGTYNSSFVADVLTGMIEAAALHQYLAAQHRLPDPTTVQAARAVEEIVFGSIWTGFPASYRTQQAEILAEQSMIEPVSVSRSTLLRTYKAHAQYFFSQVCVRQVAVSVTNASGQVDYSASRVKASGLVSALNLGIESPSEVGGEVVCYDQPQFEQLPATTRKALLGLAVGHAARPERTSYGYEVLAVESRTPIPFGPAVERVLSIAIEQSQGRGDRALARLMLRTRVRVNPAYGSWVKGTTTEPGHVQPPPVPSASSPAH